MIRFLREDRKEQIKGNRFLRYVLYALGEILLIVIGILFALQIDTWNENRKSEKTQQELIDLFLIDLKDKKQEIISDSRFFQIYLRHYRTFRNNWDAGEPMDTTNLRVVINSLTQDHWLFNTNSAAFENVSNSELWKSLPDSLTQKVNGLYYAQFGWMKNFTERVVGYTAQCKMDFLRPHLLLDPNMTAEEKRRIVLANADEFLSYVILFEHQLSRMQEQWEDAGIMVEDVIDDFEAHHHGK